MPGTLILGAGGFAASHLQPLLERSNQAVMSVARRPASGEIGLDLLDAGAVEQAVERTAPAAIANLAGAASVGASFHDPATTFAVNAQGVLHLLEAVRRHAPGAYVLCISSGDVYGGSREGGPLSEEAPVRPLSPYGLSKAAMELICRHYGEVANLKVGIARAFNHTGPGQSDNFALSSFARQIAAAERTGREEMVLEVGDLGLHRDFTDVRDVARAYSLMLERELLGVANVCSGTATALSDLVDALAAHSRVAIDVEVRSDRLRRMEPQTVRGSPRRLHEATGWTPTISLERTVVDLLDWWRERMSA